MPKRASVPQDTFAKPASALDKLTGRARTAPEEEPQPSPAGIPSSGTTVFPQTSSPGIPQHQSAEPEVREKVTFYLRPDQLDKLDELVLAYRRRTGKRINRNALLRQLIDQVDLSLLLDAHESSRA